MSESNLKRELSLLDIVAIAAGAVLGGWLVELPYWFQLSGAGSAFLFPLIALLLFPIGLAFAELAAMLPYSSAVDVFTANALNAEAGWGAQWLFFLVNVVEPPMMAFIGITALKWFVDFPSEWNIPVAILILIGWFIISNFNIRLTGNIAKVFFFGMLSISFIVMIYFFFFSGEWQMSNIAQHGGFFPRGAWMAFVAMSALVLKYIGFGMTPTMIQETTFPTKKMGRVMALALFVPAITYLLVVLSIGGLAPWTEISKMSMPAPEIVRQLNLLGVIGGLSILAGLLYALTTIMGFWTASARVLYGGSQLNQLPQWFAKTNRFGQPYLANVVVLGFGIFFSLFTGANWVQYIYSLSVLAAGLVYFIVSLDAYLLRNKHPEWQRPFEAYGGKITFLIGMAVGIGVAIGALTELPPRAYLPVAAYLLLGVVIHYGMKYYRKTLDEGYDPIILTPEDKESVGTIEEL